MPTENDELKRLGFHQIPGYAPTYYYCDQCYGMFWFHWGTSVDKAAKHRRVCNDDDS